MSDYSGIIVIEDSIKVNIHRIIKYILSKISNSSYTILCTEKTPEEWRKVVNGNANCVYYENPKDWLEFSISKLNLKDNNTIIVDSVNQLSALCGWNEFLRITNNLRNHKPIQNVILICHTDCLLYGNKMTSHLRYISQTYVSISVSPTSSYYLEVKIKLPTGKVKQYIEEVYYNSTEGKWINNKVNQDKLNAVKNKSSLPEEVASFKISVEGAARAVKEGMVLPYTQLGAGRVDYVHDAADDWDDEDPDEDLDI